MCNGFVKFPKAVIEAFISEPTTIQVYCYLLGQTHWTDRTIFVGGRLVNIRPWQVVTSRKKIADSTGASDKAIRIAIERLIEGQLLASEATNKYTIYTLISIEEFSTVDGVRGQQQGKLTANKGPAGVQQEGQQQGQPLKEEEERDINTPLPPSSGEEGDTREQGDSSNAKQGKQLTKQQVLTLDPDPGFEQVWRAYPRNAEKKQAWWTYYKLRRDTSNFPSPDELCEALRWKKASGDWEDERYIPHMATWLNRRGWEDESCKSPLSPEEQELEKARAEIVAEFEPLFAAATDFETRLGLSELLDIELSRLED